MDNSNKSLDQDSIIKEPFWSGRRKVSYSMISPGFVILLFLALGPMIFMFWNAFRNWQLTIPAPARFVGFENFIKLVQDVRFWNAFSNTIILIVVGIIVQSLIGLGIALLLKERFRFRNVVVALILIPVLIAPIVIGLNWRLLLDDQFGLINTFFSAIGINGPLWLSSTKFWGLFSIFIVDTWQWTPFVSLVLLAGLEGIPDQVYEAADVDGARPFRVFFKVTLPLLKPMFLLIALIRVIFIFRIYDPVVILTGGGPGISTETLSLLTYNTGLKYLDIGYAMSMGILQVIFMIIVANIFLKFQSRRLQ